MPHKLRTCVYCSYEFGKYNHCKECHRMDKSQLAYLKEMLVKMEKTPPQPTAWQEEGISNNIKYLHIRIKELQQTVDQKVTDE